MKAIEEAIKFLEEVAITCHPNTGCGRCNEAQKIVEDLKALNNALEERYLNAKLGSKMSPK